MYLQKRFLSSGDTKNQPYFKPTADQPFAASTAVRYWERIKDPVRLLPVVGRAFKVLRLQPGSTRRSIGSPETETETALRQAVGTLAPDERV